MKELIDRRQWIKCAGAAALGAVSLGVRGPARAAASPSRLDVRDPAAVKLGYVENAAEVDARKYPGYVRGSSCANCMQLQGKDGDAYRPCALFPGKLVATAGWCSGWTAEM